jgi:CBS domain containing-hemolysin-like protein
VALVALLGLILLYFLSLFELFLLNADQRSLERMEQEQPAIFQKISHIYHRTNSLSSSFLLSKIFVGALTSLAIYNVLFLFGLDFWLGAFLIVLQLALASWVLPHWLGRRNLRPSKFSAGITFPILRLGASLTNLFTFKKEKRSIEGLSIDEIKSILPKPDEEVSNANLNLYKQILRFDKLTIKQVMRPKSEMQGIKSNYNFKEVLHKIKASPFSRLPVYDGNWSKVQGIIHCKDLLPYTQENSKNWKELIRPVHFIKERDNVQQVLRQFQKSKKHMALVLSASNRLVGLVTLEDITEEIIGEIDDE